MTTTCTVVEPTPGRMVVCTKESTKMISCMVLESTPGKMAGSTSASGRMESSTEKVFIEKTAMTTGEAPGKMDR